VGYEKEKDAEGLSETLRQLVFGFI